MATGSFRITPLLVKVNSVLRALFRAVFIYVVTTLNLVSLAYSQERQTVDREVVMAELRNWRENVTSLKLTWRSHSDRDVRSVLGDSISQEVVDSYFNELSFEWDEVDGLRIEIWGYERGVLHYHEAWGWAVNERISWKATYEVTDGMEKMRELKIGIMNSATPQGQIGIRPLLGWYLPQTAQWLPDVIELPEICEINETTGWLSFEESPHQTLELSPKHGFMIARVTSKIDGQSSYNTVQEYKEVAPGIWLPILGYHSYPEGDTDIRNTTEWRVDIACINEPILITRFLPPEPDKGTVIENEISNKNYRHAFSQLDRMNEIAEMAVEGARSYQNPWLFGRTVAWWMQRGLVGLAILLIVSAMVSRRVSSKTLEVRG